MAKSSTLAAKKAAAARKPVPAAASKSNKPAKAVVGVARGKPVVAKGIAAAAAKGAASAPKGKGVAKVTPAAPPATKAPSSSKGRVAKAAVAKAAVAPAGRVVVAVPAHKADPLKVNGKHAPAALSAKIGKTVEVKPSKSDRHKNGHAPALPPRPIPEAVPTDGKPRKNQAGLSPKELEHFRGLLLEKRRELVGDMVSMESEALRTSGGTNLSNLPLHMADMGTDNYEQEFTLGLVEKDRNLLREINGALAKIQNGTYGICEGTQKPITKVRLEAQPWARFSIEHARSLERRIR
jgi:DnaK suppressor protein